MRLARDYLGAPFYRTVVLKSHPKGMGGGVFWEEFNNGKNTGKACVVEWAKKGKDFMPFIRVQALWDKSHNYNGKKAKALKIAKQVNKIANQFPDIDFYFSPYCEANNCDQNLLDQLKAKYSKLVIVHSANKGRPLAKNGILNETHGDYMPAQADCYSYDGLSINNSDTEKFKQFGRSLVYFMGWTAYDNGRRNDKPNKDEIVPAPNKRKYYLTVKMNQAVEYQLVNTRTQVTLQKGFMGKPNGDPDYPIPNPREDNKFVLLAPKKGNAALVDSNGKVIEKLKYDGKSHEDGRHIYRSNKWGHEIAKKCRNVQIQIDGVCYGNFDPGFRANEYRNSVK